ncbi:hypothetical protein ABK884_22295 [Enterobacter hormaechei]|jgi:hypothetical protein|uniref:hypothetical protein n=1 Tax=Enterobacter hormaechei TaxID=158836 RepID=UPI00206E9AB0|nr:MAG TPA: hypothetical protein [Caudoviricetes sp.]
MSTINRAKLQHILEYAKQQRHIGLHCKVPPEDMVEIVEAAMLQGADGNYPAIPDGLRLALSNAGIAAPESDEMLAATCEKHIQALVTWVKDRKPFQPAASQETK